MLLGARGTAEVPELTQRRREPVSGRGRGCPTAGDRQHLPPEVEVDPVSYTPSAIAGDDGGAGQMGSERNAHVSSSPEQWPSWSIVTFDAQSCSTFVCRPCASAAFPMAVAATAYQVIDKTQEWGFMRSNPVSKTDRPKPDGRDAVILSEDEYDHLVAECFETSDMLVLYASVLGETGIRSKSEAFWLRWRTWTSRTASLRS